VTTRPRLEAAPRAVTGKKVAALRRAGQLPAVIYGHGVPSQNITVDAKEFELLRRHTGRNTLIDLTVAGSRPLPVLVHGIAEDPRFRRTLHIDFYQVRMKEEMGIDVPIALVGESEAVEKHGGTLLHLRDTVHVRALPADLPSVIELDVSVIHDFETTLHVSDLPIPPRVTLITDGAELVARVASPRVEEFAPAATEAAAATETAEEAAAAGPA
jgi:large subunit ribosomal protein L25